MDKDQEVQELLRLYDKWMRVAETHPFEEVRAEAEEYVYRLGAKLRALGVDPDAR